MSEELIDLNALEEQMNSVNKQIEELKRQNIETSKKVFHGAIAAFFKMYPEVAAVRWTQYTPYFNDGDVCEFSVNSPEFYSQEDFENQRFDYNNNSWRKPNQWIYDHVAKGEDKYGHIATYKKEIAAYEALEVHLGPRIHEINAGIEKFEKVFRSIDDDIMQNLFSDHVVVTATPNGIDVDEYDHE